GADGGDLDRLGRLAEARRRRDRRRDAPVLVAREKADDSQDRGDDEDGTASVHGSSRQLTRIDAAPGVGVWGAGSVDLLDGDHPLRAEALGGLHLVAQRLGGLLQDHLDLRVLAGAVDDAEDRGCLLLAEAVALAEVEVDAHAQPARHQAGITAVAHTSTSIPGNARLWSPTRVEALTGMCSPSSSSFRHCIIA